MFLTIQVFEYANIYIRQDFDLRCSPLLCRSDKLKPTLYETVEGYIEKNPIHSFSIDDVIDYLYPQPVRADWNKVQSHKVRTSISNILSRKAYLGKHWSRIKPGVYRPRTSK